MDGLSIAMGRSGLRRNQCPEITTRQSVETGHSIIQ